MTARIASAKAVASALGLVISWLVWCGGAQAQPFYEVKMFKIIVGATRGVLYFP